jgi:hypothetical protein
MKGLIERKDKINWDFYAVIHFSGCPSGETMAGGKLTEPKSGTG